jgi:multidrug efflux system membrane fusion protein
VIDSARLQLGFCRILAPISGQVGLRQIDPGNMVHAADATGLVTVAQMDPISVLFSLPQDQLPQVQKRLSGHRAVPLEAYDRGGSTRLATGQLASLDNQIDTTTGSIKLRGRFDNRSRTLYPNQFVNIRVLMDTRAGAIVMPTAALQRGAQGTFVYVLKPDRSVSVRTVTAGPADKGEIVIEQGLGAGEQVVIDGADKLRDGLQVMVADRGAGGRPRGAAQDSGSGSGSGSARKDTPDARGDTGKDAPGTAGAHHRHARPADAAAGQDRAGPQESR